MAAEFYGAMRVVGMAAEFYGAMRVVGMAANLSFPLIFWDASVAYGRGIHIYWFPTESSIGSFYELVGLWTVPGFFGEATKDGVVEAVGIM